MMDNYEPIALDADRTNGIHYETFAEFGLAEVLSFVGQQKRRTYTTSNGIYSVKLNSPRLFLFKKSLVCCKCGLIGIIFLLQRALKSQGTPHFNLYGSKDGVIILMTKDHIIPKSKGGPDHQSNYQTMCYPCNLAKGNIYAEN